MPGSTPGTGTRQRTRGGPSRAPGNNKERWLKVPIMDEAVDQLTLIIIGCTFDLPESGGDIRNLVFGARAAEKYVGNSSPEGVALLLFVSLSSPPPRNSQS